MTETKLRDDICRFGRSLFERGLTPGSSGNISLRLDDERHLKLKLTSAHLHRSLQEIMIAALDGYLDQVGPAVMNGHCACLDGGCAARGPESEQG